MQDIHFLSKLTLFRAVMVCLGFMLLWLLFSPEENHSDYHWVIIFVVLVVMTLLWLLDYVFRKKTKNTLRLFFLELSVLLILIGLWCFFTY